MLSYFTKSTVTNKIINLSNSYSFFSPKFQWKKKVANGNHDWVTQSQQLSVLDSEKYIYNSKFTVWNDSLELIYQ